MRKILLLGTALTLAGCGPADPVAPPPGPSVSGSYQLAMVDGHDLPFTVVDLGTYKARIVSGVLALNPNGSYTFGFDLSLDDGVKLRPAAESDSGRWSVTGNAVSLTSALDTFPRAGTVSGNIITLQSSSRVFVLRK